MEFKKIYLFEGVQTPNPMEFQSDFSLIYNSWLGRVIYPTFLWMFSVPYSPLSSALEIPHGSLKERGVCLLSARGEFFLPLSREFVLQRGEVWALESLCSFSFFLVFLFFIVMMTYGNYLHRSMLCCTEWKCWSPGSLVPDALCKQPAGFAFPFCFFFSSFLFPPSLPVSLFRERLG